MGSGRVDSLPGRSPIKERPVVDHRNIGLVVGRVRGVAHVLGGLRTRNQAIETMRSAGTDPMQRSATCMGYQFADLHMPAHGSATNG